MSDIAYEKYYKLPIKEQAKLYVRYEFLERASRHLYLAAKQPPLSFGEFLCDWMEKGLKYLDARYERLMGWEPEIKRKSTRLSSLTKKQRNLYNKLIRCGISQDEAFAQSTDEKSS